MCSVTGGGYWVQRAPRERERPPLALLEGMSALIQSFMLNIHFLGNHRSLNAGQHVADKINLNMIC